MKGSFDNVLWDKGSIEIWEWSSTSRFHESWNFK